jgi:hypothetical protein
MTHVLTASIDDRVRERFAAMYTVTPSGCWEWHRSLDGKGYGTFGIKIDGVWRTVKAHRVSYEIHVGPIPEGLQLDHLCRNRACCNPSHLEPVTNRENGLRGESPCALNARVTHCPKGHEYTPENTLIKTTRCGTAGRDCRECGRLRLRAKKVVAGGLPCPECGDTYASRRALNAHRGKRHQMGTRHRVARAVTATPRLVVASTERRPAPSGALAVVWRITPAGVALARQINEQETER